MVRRVLVSVVVASAVVMSATGCASLEKRLTPEPTTVTQEATRAISGASVTGELAETTPNGLPLWPGAKVIESDTTEDAYGLSLQTADAFDDVLNGVAVGFEEAGWKVEKEVSGEQGARAAALLVSRDAEEGIVSITELEDGIVQIDYVISAAL